LQNRGFATGLLLQVGLVVITTGILYSLQTTIFYHLRHPQGMKQNLLLESSRDVRSVTHQKRKA